jgi:hypothetical protein
VDIAAYRLLDQLRGDELNALDVAVGLFQFNEKGVTEQLGPTMVGPLALLVSRFKWHDSYMAKARGALIPI